jgi:formiminoglutamase
VFQHLPLFLLQTLRMDIRYYFKPVDFPKIQNGVYLKDKNSLGYFIAKNTSVFASGETGNYKVAIVGVPYEENSPNKGTAFAPDKIRGCLYQLSNINPKLKVVDFGNIKKGSGKNDAYFAIRDVVDYLKESGVVTIILGGGQDIGVGVARAFADDKFFQMSLVDPRIDLKSNREPFDSTNYLSRILKEMPDIFNLNFIGFQSYFVPVKILDQVNSRYETFRLGQLRENITELEPVLRDTHFLSFDISSIRLQDAPGFYNGSPNGIYSEEACQISRYAGVSDNLSVFGLFEVNPKKDNDSQTSKLAAHIVWYFLEGFNVRRNDNPLKNSSDFKQFIVENEETGEPIVFYNHALTNRWWMQLENINKTKVVIACSESDYFMASKKEIPPKWLKFIRKTDRLSK